MPMSGWPRSAAPTVEAMLAPEDLVAARPWFRPITGFTLYREYRLFLNDPAIRFQGIIHEKMTPGINRLAKERGLRIVDVDLRLEHVGYDGPQEHKHRRNLPMLQAELATAARECLQLASSRPRS